MKFKEPRLSLRGLFPEMPVTLNMVRRDVTPRLLGTIAQHLITVPVFVNGLVPNITPVHPSLLQGDGKTEPERTAMRVRTVALSESPMRILGYRQKNFDRKGERGSSPPQRGQVSAA